MNNVAKHVRLVVCGAVIVVPLMAGCSATQQAVSGTARPPETSGLVRFEYGVGARNVLDVEGGTYTKDMVVDSPITVPLELGRKNLDRICDRMNAIGLASYPTTFTSGAAVTQQPVVIPFSTYRFTFTTGRETRTVNWDDSAAARDPEAVRLRDLARLIEQIIASTPEYRKLPEPRSGYR